MALSLYDVTVPSFVQILTSMSGFLVKAEAHCADKGGSPGQCLDARLFEDMFPLNTQVKQSLVHSAGALEAVQRGVFAPDLSPAPNTFPALRAEVANALERVGRVSPGDLNGLEGRDMRFEFRERRMEFTVENFLLSFSLPNFYFHATTAYDILRHNGVPLGKRDYIGQLRLKA